MKIKELSRHVRENIVEKFKARLGSTTNISVQRALFNLSSEHGERMDQLQTYQDMEVHLDRQAGQGEHYSEKQPRGRTTVTLEEELQRCENLPTSIIGVLLKSDV
ncbi:hypothetical protein ILYODFUR_032073 [Ilyodon furcidens]|uniref:Uncharacterized protein n=1 Tax=Ilyodon furcidens TaxID=33524 RepID=A0ABV0UWZ6_9TELE